MKDKLKDILEKPDLFKLEKDRDIVYFNYFRNLPKQNEKANLKILKGNSHAIVGDNLYVKDEFQGYRLLRENWVLSEEGQRYLPFLKRLISRNNS